MSLDDFPKLKRNRFSLESMPKHDGYYGAAAHLMKADRRARHRKMIKHPELCVRDDMWWYLLTHCVSRRSGRTRRH